MLLAIVYYLMIILLRWVLPSPLTLMIAMPVPAGTLRDGDAERYPYLRLRKISGCLFPYDMAALRVASSLLYPSSQDVDAF